MNCRDISTLLQRTRWWGKAAAVGAFFALGLGANAQVNAYSFSQSSGTYTAITTGGGATTVGTSGWDDNVTNVTGLPSFTFNGTAYTALNINSNGYITFGATAPSGTNYTPISSTAGYAGAVAAMARDLINNGAGSEILRQVVGSEIIIQWTNARRYSGGAIAGDVLNFQIRLNTSTNAISVVYGTCTATSGTPLTTQVGLRGATNTAFNNRTSATSWASTTAGGTNGATVTTSNTIMPASGLTFTWAPPVPCSGTPNAGTVTSPVGACGGSTAVLSATGLTTGLNISYQWQESPDGSTGWASVVGGSGATTATYTTTAITTTRYFRLVTTCSTGPASNNTNVVTVNPINPTYATFDGVSYSEGFESWSNLCSTTDVPTANWKNTPPIGDNSWRRHDQQASAGWVNPTFGGYTPVSSQGSSSARFHTYQATSGSKGNLELYIDMTAGTGSNGLTFDYINTSGTDSITILQSTDGGANFTQLGARLTTAATWTAVSRTITSTSATTVIRLRAHSDFGTTDIGVDNFQITSPCVGTPAPGATTGPALACPGAPFNLGLTNTTSGNGVSYQWYVSTTSATGPWTPVGTNAPTFAATQTAQSWYYCDVTCATGPNTGSSGVIEVNMDVPTNCYCTPTYTFGKTDGDLLSNVVIVGTTLANNSGTSPTNPSYTFFNTLPSHTANLQAGTSYTIQATVGTFGSQNIAVWIDFNEDGVFSTPSERVGFTTSVIGSNGTGTFTLSLPCDPTPGVKRMRVRDVYSLTSIGSTIDPCINYNYGETEDYNVTILAPPACPTPSGLASSSPTTTSVNLNWTIGCTETAWEVEYGAPGFTVGTGTIVSAGTNPYTLGGLSPSTTYDVYLRADCDVDGVSTSFGPISVTTLALPPANDDCGGAIALTVNTDFLCGTVTAGTTNAATASVQPDVDSGTPDDDVWFSFVATATTHRVSLLNVSGGVDMGHSVYRALPDPCAAAGMTLVSTSDPDVSNPAGLTIGETYFVRVYRWNTGASNVTFNICIGTPPPPPANDLCAAAITVNCNTITNGTTVNSTNTGAPATCSGLDINTAGGVWYSVAGFDGPMTVNLSGSSFDTKVAVFTGTCGSLVCVDSDDDDGDGTTSLLTWTGSSAQTYLIYVTGYLTNTGTFTMALTCGSTNPSCAANGLNLEFQNDANPGQVTWEVLNAGNLVVLSGTNPIPANSIGTQAICLPNGCYRLRVLDSGGDGMTTGGYELRTQGGNERIIDNTNNFSSGSVSAISNNQTFCLPIGTDKLIYSSCDKLDWVNNKFIVASANPTVSAQFGVTNTTSGYEFWFFDPNGTYSYRRFRSHATSDGFGTGATRACHFKVNGWINSVSTPHLPNNVLLNVRVRGRVAGNNLEFGPACQFKLDAALAACPRVKLQDDPANTSDFSCGVSRNFGGASNPNNRIYAAPPQPIPAVASSAVRYQFRFRIPGENICIVRPPQTSARMVLNWTTGTPLECSKTYEVDVRVSLDGGATWCFGPVASSEAAACADTEAWGKVCLVTINPCALPNGGGNSMVVEGNNTFTMYPNPNRGDQLFLSVSNVEEGVNTVNVDIFDMAGKRVMARTIAVQDGFVNTNMELNGELAGGLYVVNITAGTKAYTERLVIQP